MSEKIDNLKEKIFYLNSNTDPKTKIIIGVCITFIILFTLIGFTYGRYNPDPNSQVVQDLLSKMLTDEKVKYEQIIDEKNTEIAIILNKLTDSMEKLKKNEEEINKLKTKINNIKPPQNEKEIRQRLKELGYETK